MMTVPKISIVIPVYRTDPELFKRCLDSLIRQGLSMEDWELIVVFDGPQEPSLYEICERFSNGKNVVQTTSITRGVSAARNTGMDHASGEWLVFVDSDDALPDSALSLMLEYARVHECDLVWETIHRY